MPKMKDLTNQKIGNLFVIRLYERRKRNNGSGRSDTIWECQCDCGKISYPSSSNLLRPSNTKTCGCSWNKKGEEAAAWKGHHKISGRYWNGVKGNAKGRNIPFKITIEDAWNQWLIQNGKCAYTNLDLELYGCGGIIGTWPCGTASLDRIDSSKGYTIDNIQWVHKTVNKMKWDLSQEDFVNFCNLVTRNFNNACTT
jgi:hypothetical protein